MSKRTNRLLLVLCLMAASIVVIGIVGMITTTVDNAPGSSVASQDQPDVPLVTFSAVGDFGANDTTKRVLKQASTTSDFVLALGDFAYGQAASEEAWCSFVHQQIGSAYPFMLVVGNHDAEGSGGYGRGHFERYAGCLPNRMSNMVGTYGAQYSFDYKNQVRVVAVSPNIEVLGHKGDYSKSGEAYIWLSSTIDDARTHNIPWVVVAMHENCVSIGEKPCEIGEDILNLLIEKRVDLVLQGHEHGYMRSKQLANNTPACPAINVKSIQASCAVNNDTNTYKQGDGPILVINGTGGMDLRDITTTRADSVLFTAWHGKNTEPVNGPSSIKLYKNKMQVDYQDTTGKTVDSFTVVR